MHRKINLSEICAALNLSYIGNDLEIDGLNLCNRKSEHKRVISYAVNASYLDLARNNEAIAGLVINQTDLEQLAVLEDQGITLIVCDQPEAVFYDIHDYLYFHTDFYDKFEFESVIGENCNIHPSAVVDKGVKIGNSVTIGANSVVRKGSIIGENCTIGCNTVIGSEGFQILRIDGVNRKIIHCGGVLLSPYVYVGDNTAVCNSLFEGYTYIGQRAMIDNLVHVGHNGYVGDNAVVTAGTILCGSSIVESNAWIGVNSSVLNQVTVGCGSKIGIGSVVTKDIEENSLAYGVPAKVKVIFGGVEN